MALTPDDTLFLVNSQYNGNLGATPICIVPGRSSLHGTLAANSSENISG